MKERLKELNVLIENCNDIIRKVESMGHPNRKAIAAVYKRNLAALERERNELKNMIETEETKTESLLDGYKEGFADGVKYILEELESEKKKDND